MFSDAESLNIYSCKANRKHRIWEAIDPIQERSKGNLRVPVKGSPRMPAVLDFKSSQSALEQF